MQLNSLIVFVAAISYNVVFGMSLKTINSRSHVKQEHVALRRRRDLGKVPSVYQQISQLSGGTVLLTNKFNISSMMTVLGEVTHRNVLIKSFSMDSAGSNTRFIPVDNSISHLRIRIIERTKSHDPVFGVNSPDGYPMIVSSHSLGSGVIDITIPNPKVGFWHLNKLDLYNWDVRVYGETTLDFSTTFYGTNADTGFTVELEGNPVSGEYTPIVVQVSGMNNVASVSSLTIQDIKGQDITKVPLQHQGHRGNSLMAHVTVPVETFRISIEGNDTDGHHFTRSSKLLFVPSSLKIIIEDLKGDLKVASQIYMGVRAKNFGNKYEQITLTVSDDKGLVAQPTNQNVYLYPGLSATVYFTINGGQTAGVSSNVIVKAVRYGGDDSEYQYVMRTFTVQAAT